MDESMMERMAMAIHKTRQSHGYGGAAAWAFETEDIKNLHRATARAVLTAMREPTEAMATANGINNIGGTESIDGYLDDFSAEGVWRAMIDAALSKEEEGK